MSSPSEEQHAAGWLVLCRAEPFRIFFPLGLLSGLMGLALWPLFLWSALSIYPVLMHTRLMIEGFMGAFIIGFLAAAGPRLLSTPGLGQDELGTLLTLYGAMLAMHLGGWSVLGDALFAAQLLALMGMLGVRMRARAELPPPNFVLVGCGLVSGLAGAVILSLGPLLAEWPRLRFFGTLAVTQGFILMPVLGVGVFLFQRFLQGALGPEPVEEESAAGWKRHAIFAGATGLLLMLSLAVESAGYLRISGALRCFAAAAYLWRKVPLVLKFGPAPFLGQCIRTAVWLLLLGLLWPVFLPAYRVAGLHLVFVGGFMLTVFAVATRVLLGHSGQLHLCSRPLPSLIATAVLLLAGLGARVGADFMPHLHGRNVHLIWGALLCMAAAVMWGARLLPRAFIPDPDK